RPIPLTMAGAQMFVARRAVMTEMPPAPPALILVRPEMQAFITRELVKEATPQNVTSKSLSLSFDYCLVTVTRPWLSPALLSLREWFLAAHKEGELASGLGSETASSFEVIPMAALVVKNLEIKADWSHEERVA